MVFLQSNNIVKYLLNALFSHRCLCNKCVQPSLCVCVWGEGERQKGNGTGKYLTGGGRCITDWGQFCWGRRYTLTIPYGKYR